MPVADDAVFEVDKTVHKLKVLLLELCLIHL